MTITKRASNRLIIYTFFLVHSLLSSFIREYIIIHHDELTKILRIKANWWSVSIFMIYLSKRKKIDVHNFKVFRLLRYQELIYFKMYIELWWFGIWYFVNNEIITTEKNENFKTNQMSFFNLCFEVN